MSVPTLTPVSKVSAIALPVTGTLSNTVAYNDHVVNTSVPYKIYSSTDSNLFDANFVTGAVHQVAYVYKKLGGDVLDIELTEGNVYSAYEEATLEYSYIVNIHQANNMLARTLGDTTGSFDDKGEMVDSAFSASYGKNDSAHGAAPGVSLKYPRFNFDYLRRVAGMASSEIGLSDSTEYSGSFTVLPGEQDYDLQAIMESAVGEEYSGKINGKKILVKDVMYKTPHAMWRFYGYYGGLNVVGNMHSYGQFMDDSSFQLIPVWQNKAQSIAFEDAIYTRMSHFSYEIKDNKLRIYPIPQNFSPGKMWVRFTVPSDAWHDDMNGSAEVDGINNMNTLPLGNLPYKNINSIGKQWIRRFALALCKETLGQVRGKFGGIPLPGESLQMNGSDLLSQAKDEQEKLREELKTTLAELTYSKLAEQEAALAESTGKALGLVPNMDNIYVG